MKYCLLLIALLASGCSKITQGVEHSSNPSISVELLFVKDGVRVYRFNDGYRHVYYTDSRGVVEWDTSRGKSTHHHTSLNN